MLWEVYKKNKKIKREREREREKERKKDVDVVAPCSFYYKIKFLEFCFN